jgi:hypothetical protein
MTSEFVLKARLGPVLAGPVVAALALGCGSSTTPASTASDSAPSATSPQLRIRAADGREVRDGDVIGRYPKVPGGGCDTEGHDTGVSMESLGGAPNGASVKVTFDDDCVATVHVISSGGHPATSNPSGGQAVSPSGMVGLDPSQCPRFEAVAVEVQVPLSTPEAARDQAVTAARLPPETWTVASSTPDQIDYRLMVDGRAKAAIVVGWVPPSPGALTSGWTIQTAQRCLA